jgi:hypothetical protein
MAQNSLLYHGTVRLGTFLKNEQILCLRALGGVLREQAEREYNVVSGRIAARAREYEQKNNFSFGVETDEDYVIAVSNKGFNPLSLVNATGYSIDELKEVVKRPDVASLLVDLESFYELVQTCHVFLGDRKVATPHSLWQRGCYGENIGAVFELQLPETMIKRGLHSYPLVWWSIPIKSDYVRTIYYRDAKKVASLIAGNQSSWINFKPLEEEPI